MRGLAASASRTTLKLEPRSARERGFSCRRIYRRCIAAAESTIRKTAWTVWF